MKNKRIEAEIKPLAKHLAEYLATGIDKIHEAGMPMDFSKEGLKPIFVGALKTWNLWSTKTGSKKMK